MMPKTRYQQKQESRLYLRDKDHRDIILNDTYINALWLKKDDTDALVWIRYPSKYMIMFMRDASGSPAGNYFTILDINREIAHSVRWSNGAQTKKLLKLDDLLVLHAEYTNVNPFSVSTNGLSWGKMSKTVSGMDYYRKFGNDNSMVYIWESSSNTNQINYPLVHLEINEETKDILMYQGTISAWFPETVLDTRYLCDTADGMLIACRHNNPNRVGIYEVTNGRTILRTMMASDYNYQLVNSTTEGCRKGSFYAYAWHNRVRLTTSTVSDNIVVSVSNDMENWKTETLLRQVSFSTTTPEFFLLQRNGYFYLYVFSGNKLHAWKTDTGNSWIELNLLDYVDVKCCTKGSFVSSAFDTIRIVLNTNAELPNDNVPLVSVRELMSKMYNFGFGQDSFNNILMQDGKFNEPDEEYLGLGGWISGIPCAVYFDNMIFTPSEHNLFLLANTYDEEKGIEEIMEGDYCVDEIGKTYPYWDENTNYFAGDIVTYGGLWKCLSNNKNKPPTIVSTYWEQYEYYKGEEE